GGVYMALADVTMGIGAHDTVDKQSCATIDFEAHFLAAAKLDQWLVCRASLNRQASDVIFMQSELWAGGRQCMRASGIWKVLNIGKVSKLPA
ncbi:MAG: PaaI family thioesterase, partial [Pseudomonadota bacterium]